MIEKFETHDDIDVRTLWHLYTDALEALNAYHKKLESLKTVIGVSDNSMQNERIELLNEVVRNLSRLSNSSCRDDCVGVVKEMIAKDMKIEPEVLEIYLASKELLSDDTIEMNYKTYTRLKSAVQEMEKAK